MTTTERVPVVDVSALHAHGDVLRQAGAAVREGFGRYGLIYLSGHGIGADLLDRFYARFLDLIDGPEAAKRPLGRGDLWYQRGWTPANTERAVVAGGQPDFKECYFAAPIPPDPLSRAEYPQIHAENVWPEGIEGFKEAYTELGERLHALGEAVLRGCEAGLDLPAGALVGLTRGGPHVTRALKYLPVSREQLDAGVLWGEEHTDFNLLTLLPGGRFYDPSGAPCPRPDDAGGLYLRTRASAEHPRGEMVAGTPPAGCIVVQVGQQLEILTGGALVATPHVIRAPRTPGYSRTSAAHFVHTHSNQVLFPLSPFRTPQAVAAYRPPVLAGTYGIKTLVDIGLAPTEALESLGYRHYDRLGGYRAEEGAQP